MSDVRTAIQQIFGGQLDDMKTTFNEVLAAKAVEKLDNFKLAIAHSYFGQDQQEPVQEDRKNFDAGDPLDQGYIDGKKRLKLKKKSAK